MSIGVRTHADRDDGEICALDAEERPDLSLLKVAVGAGGVAQREIRTPDATPDEIAKRTGIVPHEVRALVPDRKRWIKSIAR